MPKQKSDRSDRPWYENWWAGTDLDEHRRDVSRQQALSRRERDDARRWASRNKPRGGAIRRMLG